MKRYIVLPKNGTFIIFDNLTHEEVCEKVLYSLAWEAAKAMNLRYEESMERSRKKLFA
jgi:hypothetical protein